MSQHVMAALAQAQQEGEGGWSSLLFMIAIMFAIWYFLVIRPQAKRERERQEMLSKLKKGDRVVTQGGIHGVIQRVDDQVVVLKVDPEKNVKITVNRTAVSPAAAESSSGGEAAGGDRDTKDDKDTKAS